MSQGYTALAASYDGLMADGDYRRRAAYLLRELRRSPVPVHTALDLGCGTGVIACLLAEEGLSVIAVDASADMLAQAARRAEGLQNPPLFLQQSMPRLRLAEPVDAVVSTLDSLNYLTRERDLQNTFQRVRKWLKPGGMFLFDVNTPYKLRRMDRQIYMDDTGDSFCVWQTFFSEKNQVCTYQVDLFRLRPDGAWERSFEEHRERAWSEEHLRQLLTDAGFSSATFTGDLTRRPPAEDEDRWQICAI